MRGSKAEIKTRFTRPGHSSFSQVAGWIFLTVFEQKCCHCSSWHGTVTNRCTEMQAQNAFPGRERPYSGIRTFNPLWPYHVSLQFVLKLQLHDPNLYGRKVYYNCNNLSNYVRNFCPQFTNCSTVIKMLWIWTSSARCTNRSSAVPIRAKHNSPTFSNTRFIPFCYTSSCAEVTKFGQGPAQK